VAKGLLLEHGDGFIIQDAPVIGDEAVVAVAVVGIEGDIGDDGEGGVGFFQSADGSRHEAIISGAGSGIAGFEFIGDAWEKHHGRHAEAWASPASFTRPSRLQRCAARHGGDGRVLACLPGKRADR
jgi:hypothetical protein